MPLPGSPRSVWLLSGELTLTNGTDRRVLSAGDTFELNQPRPRVFGNETAGDCCYVVVVTGKSTASTESPASVRKIKCFLSNGPWRLPAAFSEPGLRWPVSAAVTAKRASGWVRRLGRSADTSGHCDARA